MDRRFELPHLQQMIAKRHEAQINLSGRAEREAQALRERINKNLRLRPLLDASNTHEVLRKARELLTEAGEKPVLFLTDNKSISKGSDVALTLRWNFKTDRYVSAGHIEDEPLITYTFKQIVCSMSEADEITIIGGDRLAPIDDNNIEDLSLGIDQAIASAHKIEQF